MRRVGAVLLLKPILSLALTMHHIASRRVVRAAARAAGPRKAAREPCVVEDEAGLHARMLHACVNAAGARFDVGGELVFLRPPPLISRVVLAGVGMRCSLPWASGVARQVPSVLLDVVVLPEEARRCRGAHGDE